VLQSVITGLTDSQIGIATRGQRHLAKAAPNDPAHTAPPPITPHSEAEPGSFGAIVTDRQTDRHANIGNNSLNLTHSMQPRNERQ